MERCPRPMRFAWNGRTAAAPASAPLLAPIQPARMSASSACRSRHNAPGGELAAPDDVAHDRRGVLRRAVAGPGDELVRPHQDHAALIFQATVNVAVAHNLERHLERLCRIL